TRPYWSDAAAPSEPPRPSASAAMTASCGPSRVADPAACAARSVFRRMFRTIDHEDADRALLGFQLESQLLLHSSEDRRTVRIDRWRFGRAGRTLRYLVGRPGQADVERALEACVIDDDAPKGH